MIAAVVVGRQLALAVDRAAELAAPDHQRVVQQAALLSDPASAPRSRWSVSLRLAGNLLRQIVVLVPAAMEELDEAHAALGQPPRQQAVRREACRASAHRRPYSSKVLRRLLRQVGQLRHRASASGTPSRTARCAWRSPDRRTPRAPPGSARARSSRNRRRACALKPAGFDRYSTGSPHRAELHALIARRQKAAAPEPVVERLIVRIAAALRDHHDERRQILVLAAQVRTPATTPMRGRPASWNPVWKNVTAGS